MQSSQWFLKIMSGFSEKPMTADPAPYTGPSAAVPRFDVAVTLHAGFLDRIEIEPIGLIRLIGWSKDHTMLLDNFKLFAGAVEISPLNLFFTDRPDLPEPDRFSGFSIEYCLPDDIIPEPIRLALDGRDIWQTPFPGTLIKPAYEKLLCNPRVEDRSGIYGYGLPNTEVDPTIVAFLSGAAGRLLDFGCGCGPIVRHLSASGIDAYGIEIDRPAIRDAIGSDIRSRITLYNGELPMPFPDRSFNTVIAIEVIEHIPDFRAALRDIARVCGGTFIVTVPDMSAIPLCFPNGVVPWHLLEGTHVNFFNQTSLCAELAPYFAHVEIGRLHPREINGTTFYTSLIARCYN